jgi:hypothetical protein
MRLLTVRQWIRSDALKGQNILAQGKRSAALGCGPQVILFVFLQSGLARQRLAKPDCKKRKVGCGVVFTQGGCLACATRQRASPRAQAPNSA